MQLNCWHILWYTTTHVSIAFQLQQNPYLYDAHVELIKLLREDGELEGLREARESMSRAYPLTESKLCEKKTKMATVGLCKKFLYLIVIFIERCLNLSCVIPQGARLSWEWL